ncbi:MAG: phenylacetate-CoA oxygenase subunit PaaC [Hydrogenophaga sp.]|uniref:1,2-phenylacetyl-CoA epoxidase subunit PaaC n=1 Tax=Hydrogenophaga sp. TaxID=1904254 RepID=UPI001BC61847|nr:1,2-phenylacetyl-CoA epoxidase subunit PaaC [Hydrogenophaga sp.]MBS3912169.1 phenylacetate-CoA oxygenase subunit PaaC [Hydrogenophaga sp.]MDP2164466.1 1,2-phenylacetyl-CoA epoxidase subunit PaaC [Hydrogenophaga sp.]MDP3475125.1 1,2-phenylacetyl-CoA epoxidase subunit PaaC [Hydrogenophaga sp.]
MKADEPSAAPGHPKQASPLPGGSAPHAVGGAGAPVDYLLHLADNALVLGQRNAEWCGHGPILEEDLALANNSLDLIGQARLLYQHAASLINADPAEAQRFVHLQGARQNGWVTEDTLAYFRDTAEFRNHTLMELPHHGPLVGYAVSERDYAVTIARNFLVSALMVLVWDALRASKDTHLAAIATKSLKEVRYHLRHSSDWLVRLGDGTDESRHRAQAAVDHLLPYCEAFWQPSPAEQAAAAQGSGVDLRTLREPWNALVNETLLDATLSRHDQPHAGYVTQGHVGVHSEHLGFLLAEMQSLARAHPSAVW